MRSSACTVLKKPVGAFSGIVLPVHPEVMITVVCFESPSGGVFYTSMPILSGKIQQGDVGFSVD
jgi:hypothetical protein